MINTSKPAVTKPQMSLSALPRTIPNKTIKRHFYTHCSAPTSPMHTPFAYENPEDGPQLGFKKAGGEAIYDGFIDGNTEINMARVTYFFDDGHCGGFLSIPHLARSGSDSTAGLLRILERWLIEKISNPLSHSSPIIPILEEPIEITAKSISERLTQEGGEYLSSVSKVAIHVHAGHIFTLNQCCDDESVLWAARKFQQEYPLFLDLTVQTVPSVSTPTSPTCLNMDAEHDTLVRQVDISPFSATSYTRITFKQPKLESTKKFTEILLHFQKIRLNEEE